MADAERRCYRFLMRRVAIAISVLGWLAGTRPAAACGEWHFRDVEKHRIVDYLIGGASVYKEKDGKQGPRVGIFYLDFDTPATPLRVVKGKKIVFDIKGDKLVRYGSAVGVVTADGVRIGRTTFAIELESDGMVHELPSWDLHVKRGDDAILEGEHLYGMCRKTPPEDEIRRRVIFYLAWRELGE